MHTAALISRLRRDGVTLTRKAGKLAVVGPRGVLSEETQQRLKAERDAILETLALENDAAETGRYPLTYSQQAIWATFMRAPESIAYNLTGAALLAPRTNLDLLDEALRRTVARHAALRARFGDQDGEPFQTFLKADDEVHLERVGIERWSEEEVRNWLYREAGKPFDLRGQRPWRVAILYDDGAPGDGRNIAIGIVCNHIVADMWSIYIIFEDIALTYRELATGRASAQSEPPIQFSEIALAERSTPRVLAQRFDFWRSTMPTELDMLDLAVGGTRPRQQTYSGRNLLRTIDPATSAAIRRFAASCGATPFHVLLAALEVVLARQAATTRFCVGVSTLGRLDDDFRLVVGNFANTVPLACSVQDGMAGVDLVRAVRASLAQGVQHEVPFPALVHHLNVPRDASVTPVYQVVMAWHRRSGVNEAAREAWNALMPREIRVHPQQGAVTDIVAIGEDDGESLICLLSHNVDVVSGEIAHEVMERWTWMAGALAAQPDRPVLELAVREEDLRSARIEAQSPEPWTRSVPEIVSQHARQRPEAAAVKCGGRVMSYGRLEAASNAIAARLAAMKTGKDAIVAISVRRDENLVAALLGILKSGAAYLPIDPAFPPERLEQIVREAAPVALLCDHTTLPLLPTLSSAAAVLDLDECLETSAPQPMPELPSLDAEDLAYVLYTSGSSGRPKGVMICHRGLSALCSWMRETYGAEQLDGALVAGSLTFDITVFEIFGPLCAGGSLVLVDNALTVGECPERDDIRFALLVPSAVNELIGAGWFPPGMRTLNVGGEALQREVVERIFQACPGIVLYNLYGPTEDTVCSTFTRIRRGDERPAIGRPVRGTTAYVLDPLRNPVPKGGVGELYLGGPKLAKGYLARPDLTEERFVRDPLDPSGERRFYRTGDLVRIRDSGELEFVGRVDRQVKVRGFRIELEEVELALARVSGVMESAVVLQGRGSQAALAAFVTACEGVTLAAQGVLSAMRQSLPQYMVPSTCMVLDAMPLLASGKPDRRQLATRSEKSSQEPPVGEVQTRLAAIWSEVLGVRHVGRNDDFFLVGGHSLKASQVVSRIHKEFNVDLQISALFDEPTLGGLAALIEAARSMPAPEDRPIEPCSHAAVGQLSFAQERIWMAEQLMGHSPVNNAILQVEVSGRLVPRVAEAAFRALAEDHDAFRALFNVTNGLPRYALGDPEWISIRFVDEAQLRQRGGSAQPVIDEEIHRPFDLSCEMPLRVLVASPGPEHHFIVITMHHIATDGWSINLLGGLLPRYFAWAAGKGERPPRPKVSYADYVAWQRAWLDSGKLDPQLSAWRRLLSPLPDAACLPADRLRKGGRTPAGDYLSFALPADVIARARRISRSERTTIFMVLIAAFCAFVHRITRSTDFAIGIPVAGRRRRELETVAGFFVNMVPLRCRVGKSFSLLDFVRELRKSAASALENQDVPFERLIQELDAVGDVGHTPIFQMVFSYDEAAFNAVDLDGANATPSMLRTRTAKYDFFLQFLETAAGIQGSVEFSTDVFDRPTVEAYTRAMLAMIRNATADAEQPIDRLPLLARKDLPEALAMGRGVASGDPSDCDLWTLFRDQVRRAPQQPAIIDRSSRSIAFADLERNAHAAASGLRALGVPAGGVVGVLGAPAIETITSVLAIVASGNAYLALDPDDAPERWMEVLTQAHAAAAIIHGDNAWPHADFPVATLDQLLNAADGGALAPGNPIACVIHVREGDHDDCRPIYQRAIARLATAKGFVALQAGQRFAHHGPRRGDGSVLETWLPLLTGGTVVCLPAEALRTADALRSAIGSSHIDHLCLSAAVLNDLARAGSRCFTSLRTLVCLGDMPDREVAREIVESDPPGSFLSAYGPPECAGVAFVADVARCVGRARLSLGHVMPDVELAIVDPDRCPLPVGVPGELLLRAPALGLNGAIATIQGESDASGGARWHATGELAAWLANGEAELRGRIDGARPDDEARLRLSRVEETIGADSRVSHCAATTYRGDDGETHVACYVVPRMDEQAAGAESDRFVSEWAALYESTYRPDEAAAGAEDFSGWISSYTGRPIPTDEMRHWLDATSERILALQPRRVLEIGCGTGLLMGRIAPHLERYVGIDFSEHAVQIAGKAAAARDLPVQLHRLAAHDLHRVPAETFDLVVLNSTLQYFPTAQYLRRILEEAVSKVRDGGFIFVGDVRSSALNSLFHFSVSLARSSGEEPVARVLAAAGMARRIDKELVVDPAFFVALGDEIPRAGLPVVRPKEGAANELFKYRYDVVIPIGAQHESEPIEAIRWGVDCHDAPTLARRLHLAQASRLLLTGIPNPVLAYDASAMRVAAASAPGASCAEVQAQAAVDAARAPLSSLQALARAAEEVGFHAWTSWLDHDESGAVDLVCDRPDAKAAPLPRPVHRQRPRPAALTNNPIQPRWAQSLEPDLRTLAASRLPPLSRPRCYLFLESLPLDSTGEVDRTALPTPDCTLPEARPARAPATEAERVLGEIFAIVLGRASVGVDDNFFRIGGHSLLAMQAIARVRERMDVEVPVAAFFEHPTPARLAAHLASAPRSDRGRRRVTPVARADVLPLSHSQRQLWFLNAIDPTKAAYNATFCAALEGPIDVAALEEAFRRVVERHESLRMVFSEGDNQPVARLLPSSQVPFRQERVPSHSWQAFVSDEAATPFDLRRHAPLRGLLLAAGADRHLLIVSMHHIVVDGWSIEIFCREMSLFYAELVSGRPAALPALRLQYADFAHWQNKWRQDGEFDADLRFWTRALAGVPVLLDLPTDWSRPARRGFKGAGVAVEMPAALVKAANAAAREEGASLFMFLLGAFAILLRKLSGQVDFTIGVPVANRQQAELEHVIGFFINTLPLRIRSTSTARTARELLREIVAHASTAFDHQAVPFDVIVDAVNPPRDASFSPLVQVMFALQNMPQASLRLEGVVVRPLDQPVPAAKFDMSFLLQEREGRIVGIIEYAIDLFEERTIRRFWELYVDVVKSVVAQRDVDPDLVGAFARPPGSMVPVAAAGDIPSSPPGICAGGASLPVAGTTTGCEALDDMARRMGGALLAAMPESGFRVAIRGVGAHVALPLLLGAMEAGIECMLLDDAPSCEAAGDFLRAAGVSVLVSDATDAAQVAERGGVGKLVSTAALLGAGAASRREVAAVGTGALVLVDSTDGSVRLVTLPDLQRAAHSLAIAVGMSATDVCASIREVPSDLWFMAFLAARESGAAFAVLDAQAQASSVIDESRKRGVTVLCGEDAGFAQALATASDGPAKTLRIGVVRGVACGPWFAHRWLAVAGPDARLLNVIGLANAMPLVGVREIRADVEHPGAPAGFRPLPGVSMATLNSDGSALVEDVCGTLGVRRIDEPAWTSTPWAARAVADGSFIVLGRADRRLDWHGVKYAPERVDEAWGGVSGVVQSATVAIGAGTGQLSVSFVVADARAGARQASLLEEMRQRTPAYLVPWRTVFIDAIPTLRSGRIDWGALGAAAGADAARGETVRALSAQEAELARLWDAVLERRVTAPDADFFEMGGHSLLCVRLARLIERQIGMRISISTLYEHPKLAAMACAIRSPSRSSPEGLLVSGDPSAPVVAMLHAADGGVEAYAGLIAAMSRQLCTCAVAHPEHGTDSKAIARTIPQLAAIHEANIRRDIGKLPSVLVGWSFGGLAALELAHRWESEGKGVDTVVLVDMQLPSHRDFERIRSFVARITSGCTGLEDAVAAVEANPVFLEMLRSQYGLDTGASAGSRGLARMYAVNLVSMATFEPAKIGAAIVYVHATRTPGHAAPDELHADLARITSGEVRVVPVDSDHLGVMGAAHARTLAATIASLVSRGKAPEPLPAASLRATP